MMTYNNYRVDTLRLQDLLQVIARGRRPSRFSKYDIASVNGETRVN